MSDDQSQWVFERLYLPQRSQLLELGYGPASFWAGNAGRISTGWDVTLSDMFPYMLKEARTTSQAKGSPSVTWLLMRRPYLLVTLPSIP